MADEVVKLSLGDMLKRFEALGPLLAPTVYTAMLLSSERMVRDVITKRLSGPRGAPGILGFVSGHARRSMVGPTVRTADSIQAILGSSVGYVAAHEQGYSGVVAVRAHERRRLGAIKAVSIAKATRGKVTKRGSPTAAQRRAGPIRVGAFSRKVNIVAKHFIRDTVLEAKLPTENRILKALAIAFKTGRVPNAGQLGA